MAEHVLIPGKRSDFVHGGNAVFTIVSAKTRKRFTFKARRPKGKDVSFVSLMDGPDNVNSYRLVGIVRSGKFFLTKREWAHRDAFSHKAIVWFMQFPESNAVDVYHSGTCGRCGRRLTVPESIESGIGPECAKKAKT